MIPESIHQVLRRLLQVNRCQLATLLALMTLVKILIQVAGQLDHIRIYQKDFVIQLHSRNLVRHPPAVSGGHPYQSRLDQQADRQDLLHRRTVKTQSAVVKIVDKEKYPLASHQ